MPKPRPAAVIKRPQVLVASVEQATREKPYLYPKPRNKKVEYDIPGGSIVRLALRDDGGFVEGTVFTNPKLGNGKVIQIMHPFKVDMQGKKLADVANRVTSYDRREILDVYILHKENVGEKHDVEMVMKTFVVTSKAQFEDLMNALIKTRVTEAAVKFFGRGTGKDMDLHWLLLCVRETIIAIDMYILSAKEIWKELKEKLFENGEICKIFHDIRSESAYLFHTRYPIELRNVFDTQMAIYFMDVRQSTFFSEKGLSSPEASAPSMTHLSYALKRYLSRTVWNRELYLMTVFEKENMSTSDFYCVHPLPGPKPRKYMALSVKYLPVLKAKLMEDMMKCYHTAVAQLIDYTKRALITPNIGVIQKEISCPEEIIDDIHHLATVVNVELFDEAKLDDLISDGKCKGQRVEDDESSWDVNWKTETPIPLLTGD